MRLVLDSSRYTDLGSGVPEVIDVLERALEVNVPFVVLAELRAGFRRGSHAMENERSLGRFLRRPGITALYADEQTTHHYAAVYQQLRVQGTPIPTNDLWIAALVVQHDLVLYARDRHFDCLPQLRRV